MCPLCRFLECLMWPDRILSFTKIMQTSGKKACFHFPECRLSYTKIRKNSKTQSIRILKNAAPACSFSVLPWCRRLCLHTSCAALSSCRACVTSRPVGCRRMAEAEFGRGHTLPRWQSYANKTYVEAIKLQIRQPFLQNCAPAGTFALSSAPCAKVFIAFLLTPQVCVFQENSGDGLTDFLDFFLTK